MQHGQGDGGREVQLGLLQPITNAIANRPIVPPPVINFRESGEGKLLLWKRVVTVSAMGEDGEALFSKGNTAHPNELGLAVFDQLVLSPGPGAPNQLPYCTLTFHSDGAAEAVATFPLHQDPLGPVGASTVQATPTRTAAPIVANVAVATPGQGRKVGHASARTLSSPPAMGRSFTPLSDSPNNTLRGIANRQRRASSVAPPESTGNGCCPNCHHTLEGRGTSPSFLPPERVKKSGSQLSSEFIHMNRRPSLAGVKTTHAGGHTTSGNNSSGPCSPVATGTLNRSDTGWSTKRSKFRRSVRKKPKVGQNRMGMEIFKGHPSWLLVQAMQEGVCNSARKSQKVPLPNKLTVPALTHHRKMRREYRHKSTSDHGAGPSLPSEQLGGGTNASAGGKASAKVKSLKEGGRFDFTDYDQLAFRFIRERLGENVLSYIDQLSQTWTTIQTPGKSQALLYFAGQRFVIKTLRKAESKFLRLMMINYVQHIQANPNTFVTRFYGHHSHNITSTSKCRFVVMNNVMATGNPIQRKYDLKGSSYGRKATEEDKKKGGACIYKDCDWVDGGHKIRVGEGKRQLVLQQLELDVKFLVRIGVMDYSLLVCVHTTNEGFPVMPKEETTGALHRKEVAHDQFTCDQGGMASVDGSEIYYIGIIDILQNYNTRKRAETFWNFTQRRKDTSSCLAAGEYGQRFLDFVYNSCFEVPESYSHQTKGELEPPTPCHHRSRASSQ